MGKSLERNQKIDEISKLKKEEVNRKRRERYVIMSQNKKQEIIKKAKQRRANKSQQAAMLNGRFSF